jgi:hypothetical protein
LLISKRLDGFCYVCLFSNASAIKSNCNTPQQCNEKI